MPCVQLALNVSDIDEVVAFHTKLPGTRPAKLRSGYANSAIAGPPLTLVLLENRGDGAPSATSASRFPAPAWSAPGRLGSPGPASRRPMSGPRPAVTPGRASSAWKARQMGNAGRSTRSWPAARPARARTTFHAPQRSSSRSLGMAAWRYRQAEGVVGQIGAVALIPRRVYLACTPDGPGWHAGFTPGARIRGGHRPRVPGTGGRRAPGARPGGRERCCG